jgi:hypothetical protein
MDNSETPSRLWQVISAASLLVAMVGCEPQHIQTPPAPQARSEKVTTARLAAAGFTIPPELAGADVYQWKRIALLVNADGVIAPGKPDDLYDVALAFRLDVGRDDAEPESARLRAGLNLAANLNAEMTIWTGGFSGLIARRAAETASNSKVRSLIFVDTPHRGVSPSGWPGWSGSQGRVPGFVVSGSNFLHTLNAPANAPPSARYINIWRAMEGSSPRASVMQLPRAALNLVVTPREASIWSLLDSPVVALRKTDVGGPSARSRQPVPPSAEGLIGIYGPIRSGAPPPLVRALLSDDKAAPQEAATAWVEYAEARPPVSDPLSRITDVIGIELLADRREVSLVGFNDYFREPLRSEFFYSALAAYAAGDIPAISIDPPRPSDPIGQLPVRYEGLTSGNRLGGVLFEADRVMKTLGIAADNIAATGVGSLAPGHASIVGGAVDTRSSSEAVWRLWFEPDRWHARRVGAWAAVLDARIRVKWERMTPTYTPSGAVAHFADVLTAQYFVYTQEQPALDQLDQAAWVAAAARFAAEAGFGVPARLSAPIQTPAYTPIKRIEFTRNLDLWRITEVYEGGAVLGRNLRHVNGGTGGDARNLFLLDARPLGVIDPVHDLLYSGRTAQTILLPANADRVHQLPLARGNIEDPPDSSDEYVLAHFPHLVPISLNHASLDDTQDPPVMRLQGSGFGSVAGTAFFNGTPARIRSWGDLVVQVDVSTADRGELRVSTPQGAIMLITFERFLEYRPAPSVQVSNATSTSLTVAFVPQGGGETVTFNLTPGGTRNIRLLPGNYRVDAQAAGALLPSASAGSTRAFERGDNYTLRFDETMLALSHLYVVNNTGAPLQVDAGGRQVSVAAYQRGDIVLPAGTHTIRVQTRCGMGSDVVNVSPGQSHEVTYTCQLR